MEQGLWHQESRVLFLICPLSSDGAWASVHFPEPSLHPPVGGHRACGGWCVQGDLLLYPLLGLSGTPQRGYFVLRFV